MLRPRRGRGVALPFALPGQETLSAGLADGQFAGREGDVERVVERLGADITRLQGQGLWHPVTEDRRVELVFIGDGELEDVTGFLSCTIAM